MKSRHRKQEGKVQLGLRFDDGPLVRFEADILAAEDFACIHRSRPLSPERELMAAVLEEALADCQRCWKARDKKGMERFANAQAWILQSDSEWIFSFINCCEALGIEPGYLRRGLFRSKQGKRAKPSSASAMQRQRNQPKPLRRAA